MEQSSCQISKSTKELCSWVLGDDHRREVYHDHHNHEPDEDINKKETI